MKEKVETQKGKVENLEWKAKKEDDGKLVNLGRIEHKREKTKKKRGC
jgi:hypothetical protein